MLLGIAVFVPKSLKFVRVPVLKKKRTARREAMLAPIVKEPAVCSASFYVGPCVTADLQAAQAGGPMLLRRYRGQALEPDAPFRFAIALNSYGRVRSRPPNRSW